MHQNTTPNPPPVKPCIRDMHELVHVVLTPQLLFTTAEKWTVYVAGPMPPHLRTAVEQGHLDCEVLLVAELPAGIQEITLPDHRREYCLQKAA